MSFGGGAVAYLREYIVREQGWLDDEGFLSAMEISETVPGLIAVNMSVIVGDNLVRGGAVLDPASDDAASRGSRRFTEMLGAEPGLSATLIQTVGSKGWDGFALAVVER